MTFCPQAVIFDMDGLLIDSEPVWGEVEDELLAKRGKTLHHEIRQDLIGLRMRDFWAGMIEAYDLDEAPDVLISEVVSGFIDRLPEGAPPRPGAVALVALLHENKVPIAIASSSPHAIIDGVVGALNWGAFFPIRVSGDDVEHGKPTPDIYLESARRLGVAPSDCLALEDSRNGARAAVAAGMVTYVVPDLSHATEDGFSEITPHVFKSLVDVQETLVHTGCWS
jgi:HAD superfamily hydrolase (TIGR01509 family)